MAKHTYDVTIGGDTYTVESDSPLSDSDAYTYAKQQHESSIANDPVAQRARIDATNAVARANMAKQPTEAELQARAKGEPWTNAAMLDRAKSGAKGEAEGFVGGLVAPLGLLYHGIRHPLDTADAVGEGALALGGAAVNAATDPAGTYEDAKHAVVRFASDPENIGATAGGIGAMIAAPRITKAIKSTKLGQAVVAGVSDAVNRIPGVKAARAFYAPAPAKVVKPTAAAAKAAAEAARLAENGVVPTADAAAASGLEDRVYPRVPYAPLMGPSEDEAIRDLVVPTADASASNPSAIARATDSAPYPAIDEPPVDPHAAVRDMVVPTADAAASMPSAELRPTMRRPYEPLPPDSPLAKIREQMGLRLDRPNEQVLLGETAEPDPNPFRGPDPSFLQEGMGGRGQESVVKGPAALSERLTVPATDAAPARGLEATMTAEERALIGNRGKGALTLAQRQALLKSILERSRQ